MRVRASSTVTQANGARRSARRLKGLVPSPSTGLASKADQQAEDAVIEGKIEAEKKQQPGGGERAHASVLAHGVVDPVASSGVPEDAAGISQKKSLSRLRRQQLDSRQELQSVGLPGPQQGDQQWSDGYPAQKIQLGKGKTKICRPAESRASSHALL